MDKTKEENYLHLSLATYFSINNDKNEYMVNGIKMENKCITKGYYFVRDNNYKIKKLSQHSEINEKNGEKLLFRVRKSKNNHFAIESPISKIFDKNKTSVNSLNDKLWYILKSNTNKNNNTEKYVLNKNDIIKLGEAKYEIIEKNIENKNKNDDTINYLDLNDQYNISKNNKSESIFNITTIKNVDYSNKNKNNLCRICFDGGSSLDNPKIVICNCHDYIHYECLKAWIKTKITTKENLKKTVLSYIIKKFNCDVCLKPYPLKFKISGVDREYSLVNLLLPIGSNYIVLESLGMFLNGNNLGKIIHIVKLTDEYAIIGRKDTCDIIDLNRQISREHAAIKFNEKNGDVILENRSKTFDTLILVKKPIIIKEKEIDLQTDKTIINAKLLNNYNNSIKEIKLCL